MPPQIGDLAPDFELPALIGGVKRRFRLSSQRNKKNVLLAFYPSNWVPVSAAQLASYQAEKERLDAIEILPVSVSVDSIMNTTAWEREIGPLDFPMCSDFWPHGDVAKAYGVLREQDPQRGACDRVILLVNKAGRLIFRRTYGLEELPPFGQTVEAVERNLQSK
jgi:alkyl hydroperoxide reductase subunit AhpC